MCAAAFAALLLPASAQQACYVPTPEVLESRREFASDRFGVFIHWGIYSMFGQGEWYLNYGPTAEEYMKAARGFYPADFDVGCQGRRREIYLHHHASSRRFLDV